jgi:hypothetical protein
MMNTTDGYDSDIEMPLGDDRPQIPAVVAQQQAQLQTILTGLNSDNDANGSSYYASQLTLFTNNNVITNQQPQMHTDYPMGYPFN